MDFPPPESVQLSFSLVISNLKLPHNIVRVPFPWRKVMSVVGLLFLSEHQTSSYRLIREGPEKEYVQHKMIDKVSFINCLSCR